MPDFIEEEHLLRAPLHPAHRDGYREALAIFLVVPGIAFMYWTTWAPDWLDGKQFWAVIFIVALGLAVAVRRAVATLTAPRTEHPEVLRQQHAAATEHRIAEAKARGDFDRWDGDADG